MRPLFPSLDEIERGLLRPSDDLLGRLAAGDHSVPDELRRAVEADAESVRLIEELRATAPAGSVSRLTEAVPPYIADLIRRRVAHVPEPFVRPSEGLMLSVERVVGPRGDMGWDLSRPLAVLLDSPSVNEDGTENNNIWYGWMVAPETDYASHWDFVLAEEDGPFDPLLGAVQVWNPVYVYLKSASRVLGKLALGRMVAVRALTEEYLTGPEPDPADARPGLVALRATAGGMRVLTGTPLSGRDDPRWYYQEIYHAVAEAIRLPARLAQAASQLESPIDMLTKLLAAARDRLLAAGGWILNPVPVELVTAPAALGEEAPAEPDTARLPGLVEFKIQREGDRDNISMTLLSAQPLRVTLVKDKAEIARYLLRPEQPGRSVKLDAGGDYDLAITDLEGKVLHAPPEDSAVG